MVMLKEVSLLLLAQRVRSHGHMVTPPSRQQVAFTAGGATFDDCPHCVLAEPLLAEGNGAEDRHFPGNRAFAEPGTASSVDFLMNGQNPFGVCGTQFRGSNDYNHGMPGVWGEDVIVAQYTQGQIIDVEWCLNADHGGVYSWRLCDDPEIVAKFWGDAPLSVEDYLEAEACFQRGILRCDDVEENSCALEPFCASEWGCADDPGKFFHCEGTYPGEKDYSCRNSDDYCPDLQGSYLVKRKVKIPIDFLPGKTILSWRWDSHETTEIFAGCADIYIGATNATLTTPEPTPSSQTPITSPVPTPLSTPAPTLLPSQGPTPTPTLITDIDTPISSSGVCCWWSPLSAVDMCLDCQSYSEPDDYCAESSMNCNDCGGTWCHQDADAVATMAPSMGPTITPPIPSQKPTLKPAETPIQSDGICCWWSPLEGDDMCLDCQSFSATDNWCAQSSENCDNCGGTWCT